MILGSKARYAVMAMVELASCPPDRPVSLMALASAQDIALAYLEQIFSKLRQRELVVSSRGPGGGYRLALPAEHVTLFAIVSAVEESLAMTRCDKHAGSGCMPGQARCATHDVWDGLERQIEDYLASITLADVLARYRPSPFFRSELPT